MGINIRNLGGLAARLGFSLAGSATTGAGTSLTVTTGATTGAYDPATDTVATSGGTTTPITAIAYKRSKSEEPKTEISDKRVAVEKKVFLIQCADLPAGAAIDRNTKILEGATRWWVLEATQDPAGATWQVDVGR